MDVGGVPWRWSFDRESARTYSCEIMLVQAYDVGFSIRIQSQTRGTKTDLRFPAEASFPFPSAVDRFYAYDIEQHSSQRESFLDTWFSRWFPFFLSPSFSVSFSISFDRVVRWDIRDRILRRTREAHRTHNERVTKGTKMTARPTHGRMRRKRLGFRSLL